jgi:hypothetical protein
MCVDWGSREEEEGIDRESSFSFFSWRVLSMRDGFPGWEGLEGLLV